MPSTELTLSATSLAPKSSVLSTCHIWPSAVHPHHCLYGASGYNLKVPAPLTSLNSHCCCTKSRRLPCLDVRPEHLFPAFLGRGFKGACLSLDRNPTGPDPSSGHFMAKNTSVHMAALDFCPLGSLGLGSRQSESLWARQEEEEVLAQEKPHLPS